MTTKLVTDLKREIAIGRQAYTLTISTKGFVLALKGRRKGLEISWDDLVSGDAAMATALNASLSANIQPKSTRPPEPVPPIATHTRVSKTNRTARKP